jgi:hypothetical protein
MEMELLKVGDKVYNEKHHTWSRSVSYQFSTVERLTATQAILSCGTRLVNKPQLGFDRKTVQYPTHGDLYTKWSIPTLEVIEEARLEEERQTIVRWFDSKKFTEDEKRIVYAKFKKLGLL